MTHHPSLFARGLTTVRQHRRFAAVGVLVVGLLMAPLAPSGCRPAKVTEGPLPELAGLDPLLRLMRQRLILMHEVARWKWHAGQSITDPQRERELLRTVVERGRSQGLDPEFVGSFFLAQMEAARLVQQGDFERWKANREEPGADTTSLTVLRQQIDGLNGQLLDALTEVGPRLGERAVQQALPGRAEAIFASDDLNDVRETAIAPLRRR